MAVTKAVAKEISTEITEAVKKVLEKHGLGLGQVRSTYGDIYSIKIEATEVVNGDSGINLASKEAQAYNMFASSYGLNEGLLGKKFVSRGREFAFAGVSTSRSKYPIMAVNLLDNKKYFFTRDIVKVVNA